MKSTGLQRFETATVDMFTSDFGLKLRKSINVVWRRILKLGIKRKVFIESYPKLERKKNIFLYVTIRLMKMLFLCSILLIEMYMY